MSAACVAETFAAVSASGINQDLLEPIIAPIALLSVEICVMLYLDGQNCLVGIRHVRGRRSGVEIPVRLLVADALAFDARGAIMAHNHPSGVATASRDDFTVTGRLARAFEAVGVRLIDHIVLAGTDRTSFRAGGYL